MLNESYNDGGWELKKYPESNKAQLEKVFNEIVRILGDGYSQGFIGQDDLAAAIPEEPKAARLYGMCKDHKEIILEFGIPPLRPVISCSGTILDGSGKIWDAICRPVDQAAASYIQDTTALLTRVQKE